VIVTCVKALLLEVSSGIGTGPVATVGVIGALCDISSSLDIFLLPSFLADFIKFRSEEERPRLSLLLGHTLIFFQSCLFSVSTKYSLRSAVKSPFR
jgi:hypothetical protein